MVAVNENPASGSGTVALGGLTHGGTKRRDQQEIAIGKAIGNSGRTYH
jgi:hypothetical protein